MKAICTGMIGGCAGFILVRGFYAGDLSIIIASIILFTFNLIRIGEDKA